MRNRKFDLNQRTLKEFGFQIIRRLVCVNCKNWFFKCSDLGTKAQDSAINCEKYKPMTRADDLEIMAHAEKVEKEIEEIRSRYATA